MPTSSSPTWIDLAGVANARDLGGLPTVDGRLTCAGSMLRSAHLGLLEEDGVRLLTERFGVSDVVDLRSDSERRSEGPSALRRAGVTHHDLSLLPLSVEGTIQRNLDEAIPVTSPGRDSEDLRDMTAHYIGYLKDRPENLAAALRAIAEAPGAVLVNCAAGKDRTGTVVALALSLAGVVREAVIADYVASAERIEDIRDSLAGTRTYSRHVQRVSLAAMTPVALSMEGLLDHVDSAYGGPHGLAASLGVDEQTVNRLAARIVAGGR